MEYRSFSVYNDYLDFLFQNIASISEIALKEKGAFHIVLSGGRTPINLFRRLRFLDTYWEGWHFWLADERCVSQQDPLANAYLLHNELISYVSYMRENIHFVDGSLGLNEGTKQYIQILKDIPFFDLALLGVGEDGHIASLFPGNEWGCEKNAIDALAVNNSPKPPSKRITMSANRLSRSEHIFYIASGQKKKEIVEAIVKGNSNSPSLIIQGSLATKLIYCYAEN